MRRILDEVARMKKIAGIISENKYEEGADMATSEEITMEGDEVNEDYENQEVNKVYGKLYKILDAAGYRDGQAYNLMYNAQKDPNTVYVVILEPSIYGAVSRTIDDAVESGAVQFGDIKPEVVHLGKWKHTIMGEPMPPSKWDPGEDDEEEFDEDELPPINKAELVSFIRKAGPKPTGAKPRGEFNVSLEYVDYPSIPDSYMTGAMDVFMCVVKACGGKAKLEGEPGANQMYTVTGCSFDSLQAIWQFLASEETYETAGDSDTIVQANGCAQTWEISEA